MLFLLAAMRPRPLGAFSPAWCCVASTPPARGASRGPWTPWRPKSSRASWRPQRRRSRRCRRRPWHTSGAPCCRAVDRWSWRWSHLAFPVALVRRGSACCNRCASGPKNWTARWWRRRRTPRSWTMFSPLLRLFYALGKRFELFSQSQVLPLLLEHMETSLVIACFRFEWLNRCGTRG